MISRIQMVALVAVTMLGGCSHSDKPKKDSTALPPQGQQSTRAASDAAGETPLNVLKREDDLPDPPKAKDLPSEIDILPRSELKGRQDPKSPPEGPFFDEDFGTVPNRSVKKGMLSELKPQPMGYGQEEHYSQEPPGPWRTGDWSENPGLTQTAEQRNRHAYAWIWMSLALGAGIFGLWIWQGFRYRQTAATESYARALRDFAIGGGVMISGGEVILFVAVLFVPGPEKWGFVGMAVLAIAGSLTAALIGLSVPKERRAGP